MHEWLFLPMRLVAQPVTAIGLGVVLNLFFKRHADLRERLKEMAGKTFHFQVEDLGQDFFMDVDADGSLRIHSYADEEPHVVMAGASGAFLSLLFKFSDPDSLFFSRRLKLSGETDTGLRFKNLLDNVDVEWERELAQLVTPPVARMLITSARNFAKWVEERRDQVGSSFDQVMNDFGTPRKSELDDLRQEVEALVKDVDQLERATVRASRRLAMKRSGMPDGDADTCPETD